MSVKTKMQQTTDCGSDWWNDSNDHVELGMHLMKARLEQPQIL